MTKKILYITTSFDVKNSSATIRNNILVKGLVEKGYKVDVLTVKWPDDLVSDFFVKNNNASSIKRTSLKEISLNDNLKKAIKLKSPIFNRIKQLIKEIVFFPDTCSKWKNYIDIDEIIKANYDLIITSSDHKSSHYIGEIIKKKMPEIIWAQVWGDPWEQDINTPLFLKFKAKREESKILRKASAVFYVSPLTQKQMGEKYKDIKHIMHYIPRGFYFSVEKNKAIIKDSYHIVYTGLLGIGRDISTLASVLDEYNKIPNQKSIIIDLYGNYSDVEIKRIEKFSSINIHNSVGYDDISNIYANADALIFISNHPKTTQIPGKLFDYFGTTKPIISLINNDDQEIASFMKQFDRCLILENSKQSIQDNMDSIIKKLNTEYKIDNNFSSSTVSEMFINKVNEIK